MDKTELEIVISAVFLLVFMGFFFNSGASSFITGGASITGTAIYDNVPSELKIVINNDDYSTDKNEVILSLHAEGALECRYKNSGVDYWSSWTTPVSKRVWSLTSGLGEKEISYQCRSNNGYSGIASDSILVVS